MSPIDLIDKYYTNQPKLRNILVTHSEAVARRALKICDSHPEMTIDREFLYEAAMLHDIGIFQTDAAGIECFGTLPYICHGRAGADLLRSEGLPRHARVAERHTGTGLTVDMILRQNLPLPAEDFVPETLEEQIVCYADKFYSKSNLEVEKSYDRVLKSLSRFGVECVEKFESWHERFENS